MNEWFDDSLDLTDLEQESFEIYHARSHMQAVIEILYGKSSILSLEHHLEEICSVLGLNIPNQCLLIKKEVVHGE